MGSTSLRRGLHLANTLPSFQPKQRFILYHPGSILLNINIITATRNITSPASPFHFPSKHSQPRNEQLASRLVNASSAHSLPSPSSTQGATSFR